jgi:transcriptional regulator with XRE-family HTH domain
MVLVTVEAPSGTAPFGDVLRDLRQKAGLSQRQLAMSLAEEAPWTEAWWDEIDRLCRSIRRWEKDTIPRGDMMLKLARSLRLPTGLDTQEE